MKKSLEKINEIEKSGTDRFRVDGINWWPLIRVLLFQKKENQKIVNSSPKLKLSYFKRLAWDLQLIFRNLRNGKRINDLTLNKLPQSDFLFVGFDNHFVKKKSETLENNYVDAIFEDCKESKVLLLKDSKKSGDKYKSLPNFGLAKIENLLDRRRLFLAFFRTLLFKSKSNYYDMHKDEFDSISDIIIFEFKFQDFDLDKFIFWINRTKESEEQTALILKKVKPKTMVQYCYYYPKQFGSNVAAHKLGITSVDYQHGSQNPWHYAYGNWHNVPNSGYELLPDEFWVFSEKEKRNLDASFSNSLHKVMVTGNKAIELWRKKSQSEKLNWIEKIKEKNKVGLFTMGSYLLDSDHIFWSHLKRMQDCGYFLIMRLHPLHTNLENDLLLKFNECQFTNYKFDKDEGDSLFDILNSVDFHITQSSMVAEDALYFDHHSIILDEVWEFYFEDYISEEKMFLPRTEEELEKVLELVNIKVKY